MPATAQTRARTPALVGIRTLIPVIRGSADTEPAGLDRVHEVSPLGLAEPQDRPARSGLGVADGHGLRDRDLNALAVVTGALELGRLQHHPLHGFTHGAPSLAGAVPRRLLNRPWDTPLAENRVEIWLTTGHPTAEPR